MQTHVTTQHMQYTLQVEPENYPDKKDTLIGEFRNYLKILRAVHSGADLQASAEAAGGSLPGNAKGFLGYVLSHQQDSQILPLIENGVEARTELQQGIKGNRWDCAHIHAVLQLHCSHSQKIAAMWNCTMYATPAK